MIKNKKGFTLIEIILVLSILSILILVSSNAIGLMFKSHTQTYRDYDLQSSARIISNQVGETIKYSQAVFAVPIEYVEDINKMDPEWEFITLSADKKSVIKYKYNPSLSKHEATILLAPQDNIEYEIKFEKKSDAEEVVDGETIFHNESVLYYSIVAYNLKKNDEGLWEKTAEKIIMESEVNALNALQVVDKGTASSPAVALAYRKDDETYGEGRSHVVKVGLVLDASGSMNNYEGSNKRIDLLKNALIGSGRAGESGMIAQFAVYPNFEISIVPFSNKVNDFNEISSDDLFYNAQLDKSDIVTGVNGITPSGNTNTGDGVRQAYYNLTNYSTSGYSSNVEEHDFTIVLVDGDSNTFSYSDYTEDVRYNWFGWRIVTDRNYNYIFDDRQSYLATTGSSPTDEDGFGYVTQIGNKIINEDNFNGTYYLIGYIKGTASNGTAILDSNGNVVRDDDGNILYESDGVSNIREALNIPREQVFNYSDPNFDLNDIFANIATDIMAKTWLVTGPQIKEVGGE